MLIARANGPDRGRLILGIAVGFTTAAVLFTALRLMIRIQRGMMSWDDGLIAVAAVSPVSRAPDHVHLELISMTGVFHFPSHRRLHL